MTSPADRRQVVAPAGRQQIRHEGRSPVSELDRVHDVRPAVGPRHKRRSSTLVLETRLHLLQCVWREAIAWRMRGQGDPVGDIWIRTPLRGAVVETLVTVPARQALPSCPAGLPLRKMWLIVPSASIRNVVRSLSHVGAAVHRRFRSSIDLAVSFTDGSGDVYPQRHEERTDVGPVSRFAGPIGVY